MTGDQFTRKMVEKLADMALTHIRPRIPSKTLRKAVNAFVLDSTHSRIQIPHYWAIYLHDGRGPFGPREKNMLVWFRNPLNDPRLRKGNKPVRASHVQRLTKDEFYGWLARNRKARKNGQPVPMIVTPYVSRPAPPTNFFLNDPGCGMEAFPRMANDVVRKEFGEYVKKQIKRYMNVRDKATITL